MDTDGEIYDSTLLGILQNEGQIAKFLDITMGFLYRRTDFFHLMKSREDRIGFPPGVSARLLIQTYEKYENLARQRDSVKETRTVIPSRQSQIEDEQKPLMSQSADVSSSKSSEQAQNTSYKKPGTDKSAGSTPGSQKEFQANPDSYNGAIRDAYKWSQTIKDCDLLVKVPNYIVKARQVKVTIQRKHVKVSYINEEQREESVLDSDLTWDINVNESMWSLVPKEHIHINLEKIQERWWENVLTDEPKIDTQKIEATVPMDHLDEEAQAVVGKMMYDEEQKRKGLPTSDQQKIQETLKKAWNAEGSPFQGTPYDPSLVDIKEKNS